jgi:hypothetical protein
MPRHPLLILVLAGVILAPPAPRARAAPVTFLVTLSGAQVVPPVATGVSGFAQLQYDDAAGTLRFDITLIGAAPASIASAELRQGGFGASGPVALTLTGGGWTKTSGVVGLPAALAPVLFGGGLYVQVNGPSGPLLRGQVLGPAVPGPVPTVALPLAPSAPTTAPSGAAPAAAQDMAGGPGAIRPPATGDAGLRTVPTQP